MCEPLTTVEKPLLPVLLGGPGEPGPWAAPPLGAGKEACPTTRLPRFSPPQALGSERGSEVGALLRSGQGRG